MIGKLALRQHGVVSRRQLRELGYSASGIDSRMRRGALLAIHQGVYAVGHRKLAVEGRWMASVLASGPDAVLSHRSAGQLWRVVRRSGSLPNVTRPRTFRDRTGIVAHRSPLPADEIDEVAGIPVTSISRTLLDLGTVLRPPQLEQALNQAEVLRLTGRASLPILLERYPHRRGTAILRRLLGEEDALRGITRRELEARFAVLVDAYGLPRPRRNASLAVRGRFFEVDCLWEARRLVVELDGRATHGTGRAFEADRVRDRWLVADGWRVIRITWRQLDREAPAIARLLGELLSTRRPDRGSG